MKVYVLSENHPNNRHVGWSVSHNLEAVLVDTLHAEMLYPFKNHALQGMSWALPDAALNSLQGWQHRLSKSWYSLDSLPHLEKEVNVLLIVGLHPFFLLSMHALGPILEQFDVRIGYVLDGFNPDHVDRAAIPHLDHLFVISPEIADSVSAKHPNLNVSCLPIGINTATVRFNFGFRPIDILGYGRCKEALHQKLLHRFNSPVSNFQGDSRAERLYLYSTFTAPDVFDLNEHMRLQAQLLNRSKISLCFEASQVSRFSGHSPILYRWFEAWAHGCIIVGKRPFGRGVAELMDWQDSTFELPEDEANWIPFLEQLLTDEDRLAASSLRNYQQALRHHDWRDRLCQMLKMLDLPIPKQLQEEIYHLQIRADHYSKSEVKVHHILSGAQSKVTPKSNLSNLVFIQ